MKKFIVTVRQTTTATREYQVLVDADRAESAGRAVVADFDAVGFDHHDVPKVISEGASVPEVVDIRERPRMVKP